MLISSLSKELNSLVNCWNSIPHYKNLKQEKNKVNLHYYHPDGSILLMGYQNAMIWGRDYPHAYESGSDYMSLIVDNLKGSANDCVIGNYKNNTYMMKYNEVMFKWFFKIWILKNLHLKAATRQQSKLKMWFVKECYAIKSIFNVLVVVKRETNNFPNMLINTKVIKSINRIYFKDKIYS